MFRVTIDTLKQLAESPIGCGAWGEQNREFFLESLDDAGQKIGVKLEDINDITEAVKVFLFLSNKDLFVQLKNSCSTDRTCCKRKVCLLRK